MNTLARLHKQIASANVLWAACSSHTQLPTWLPVPCMFQSPDQSAAMQLCCPELKLLLQLHCKTLPWSRWLENLQLTFPPVTRKALPSWLGMDSGLKAAVQTPRILLLGRLDGTVNTPWPPAMSFSENAMSYDLNNSATQLKKTRFPPEGKDDRHYRTSVHTTSGGIPLTLGPVCSV